MIMLSTQKLFRLQNVQIFINLLLSLYKACSSNTFADNKLTISTIWNSF